MKVLKKLAMNFEAYLCAIAIAVMSVVVFVQVVFRFIVKSSLPWSEELSRYLQVYITFFGTAYGIQTGAHLGIEAFTHLLPKGGRKVLAILVQIVSMLVCTLILKLGVDIVMSQMASGQVSPAMRIPMWVIYGAIPMGMAFCVIRYIVEIYHSVKNFNKPEDREVLERQLRCLSPLPSRLLWVSPFGSCWCCPALPASSWAALPPQCWLSPSGCLPPWIPSRCWPFLCSW